MSRCQYPFIFNACYLFLFLLFFVIFAACDASGRYRGQFLFDNNHWMGSAIVCDELKNIDEMEFGFYVATVMVKSPEPMMKVCFFQFLFCVFVSLMKK